MQSAEDYYERFLIGTFIRWVRFVFFLIALLLPAIYVAISTFQPEMIPTNLLLSIAAPLLVLAAVTLIQTLQGRSEEVPPKEVTIRGVNLSGALMLAFYCRPTFLIWAALAPLTLLLVNTSLGRRWQALAAVALTSVFLLAPWVVRNIMVFDAPVIATTHGGYTLLWGNNREYYEHLRGSGGIWDSTAFHNRFSETHPHEGTSASELHRDRTAHREAVRTISSQPGMFAYSSLLRLTSLWRPWPLPLSEDESLARRALRYAVGAWYWVVLPLAAYGWSCLGRAWLRPEWLIGLLLPLSFTAVHLFYWTDMRMRAPLMPVVAVLACVTLSVIFTGKGPEKSQTPA
jgi:hypothetical protein